MNPTPGQNPPQWLVELIDQADPMHPRDYWRKRNLADEIQARFEQALGESGCKGLSCEHRHDHPLRTRARDRWYTESKEETNDHQ